MRTTVIPAQITTVEDKVIGKLSFSQLILLTIPVILSGVIFALLPAKMSLTFYKLPVIIFCFSIFGLLSLRIKGKLILDWIIIISKFNLRPRYYILNKNNTHLRKVAIEPSTFPEKIIANLPEVKKAQNRLTLSHLFEKEGQLLRQKTSFTFKENRKGESYVVATKI